MSIYRVPVQIKYISFKISTNPERHITRLQEAGINKNVLFISLLMHVYLTYSLKHVLIAYGLSI